MSEMDLWTLVEPMVQSPNKHYSLGWINEAFVLFERGRPLVRGRSQRAMEGAVADTGTFVLGSASDTATPACVVMVREVTGNLRHTLRFPANVLSLGIANDGSMIVIQLANADSPDGGTLQLVDLKAQKVLWSVRPATGWADLYHFDLERRIIDLEYVHQKRARFSYSLQTGELLDAARWERDRIQWMTAFQVYELAKERYGALKRTPTPDELTDANHLVGLALERGLSQYPRHEALAYRMLGDMYAGLAAREHAITCYERAMSIDPKVGVKKKLAALKANA